MDTTAAVFLMFCAFCLGIFACVSVLSLVKAHRTSHEAASRMVTIVTDVEQCRREASRLSNLLLNTNQRLDEIEDKRLSSFHDAILRNDAEIAAITAHINSGNLKRPNQTS